MGEVTGLVDHLFRRHAGRMVSTLTSILGARNLEMAEDVVQEALIRALQLWPFQGVPRQPEAWLIQVARNLAFDRLRRDRNLESKIPELERRMTPREAPAVDDQLAMMFLCCHPRLPEPAQISLTLKTVCGFSVAEIGRALLISEDAAAQRVVRAKRQIREEGIAIEMPGDGELPARRDAVLRTIYLVFNEGYAASGGPSLLRRELCEEAVYLTRIMAAHPIAGSPVVHALLALMIFHQSRMDARTDDDGNLLLLDEQDRGRWDRRRIAEAFSELDRSCAGTELTAFHIEAAIAASHAAATSMEDTDWPHIASLYDQLAERNPSPIVLLNRAVAIARVHGPEAGLDAIDGSRLENYYLLHATRARLLEQAGDFELAADCYRAAIACPCNDAERRYLESRLLMIARVHGNVGTCSVPTRAVSS